MTRTSETHTTARALPAPLEPCLCDSGKSFGKCCQLYLEGRAFPQTAEALMRSRFCAFATGNLPYLRKTWHQNTRPDLSAEDLQTHWVRLSVIRTKQGLKKAIVEFKAWYLIDAANDSQAEALHHEISLFKKVKGRWVYLEPLEDWP